MPTASREYVCKAVHGDYDACVRARDAIVADLRRMNEHRRVANYDAQVMAGAEDLEAEAVDVNKATQVTGGQFPLLWLNLTFDPARVGAEALAEMEARHDLVLIAQGQSRVSYF